MSPAPIRGYAATPHGRMHYAELGEGPAVLLLHQTPRSSDEFREVQPLLAEGRRVIAMDMRGFGLSAPLPAPQTIEAIAEGAYGLLDALGVERATVLGHHTGGAVAIEMAAAAPQRVEALILSSAPWTDAAYRESHAGGPGVDEAGTAEDGSHLTKLWALRQPYYPAGRPDLLDRFIRDALAPGVDPAEGHRACARYVMEDRIGLVTAPVLLIGASEDPFALPDVDRLRKNLTNAVRVKTAVIEGGTIPLMEQKADEVAAATLQFLGDLA
ncbi:alpha/beta fold hydrolase [Paractinoplanes brasiliensis]|uniref:Pimeloyl-ACP methyl ester carboxylesterase n=1 Tax=Paractinoplanes brasiliensis TaxID=52695 RepID=A0A4R6JR39_9ACTN|nr:alpha/beta hydrolase [Actinoplanes brasiliensis]TDO37366.1 pimeloyl-ACP methyl ester carboxylesterase [Actinoplanes brasiliensis]GID29317.1 alpha/beta hydrolase [Actinoplanes brasiliensis]